jgi:hypothetical protein
MPGAKGAKEDATQSKRRNGYAKKIDLRCEL